MKIRILTSCTGEKKFSPANQLREGDFRLIHESAAFAEREASLAEFRCSAAEIYTGQQHVRLMRGIAACAGTGVDCEVSVLSAGYGLIPGDRPIVPYEMTFQGMGKKQLREWAEHLRIAEAARQWFAQPADLNLILLGESYLSALGLDDDLTFAAPTLFLCGKAGVKLVKGTGSQRVVALSNREAKRFSCGLVALKGEIAARLLGRIAGLALTFADLMDPMRDVLADLDSHLARSEPMKTDLEPSTSDGAIDADREQRFSVFVPRKNAELLYFIPEWDDRVDPEYDFMTDTATHGRDPYSHDVYAHEIYDTPPYDGILISQSVIEQNKTKKRRVQEIGIHAHLRVPRNFPIMGDCGAFSYIDEEVPPYETEETVRSYEELGFDFGVSIDHLIVPAVLNLRRFRLRCPDGTAEEITEERFKVMRSEGFCVREGNSRMGQQDLFLSEPVVETWMEEDIGEAERRWEITLSNSRDFIGTHRRLGCGFTPVAGCQGWDMDSQVEMFRLQQDMGYNYIALGGLVRSPTPFILGLLDRINGFRRPGTRLHVFGVARLDAVKGFLEAGVSSVDSASMLRQAWLSSHSNYYFSPVQDTVEALLGGNEMPKPYAAVRIPPLTPEGGGPPLPKAKAAVADGASLDRLLQCEQVALESLHSLDHGGGNIDEALAALMEYGTLLGLDPRYEKHYRRLLLTKPWQQCPCAICRSTGVDVAIFRRNNRNRRRGFHNTWWFYQVFRELTSRTDQGA